MVVVMDVLKMRKKKSGLGWIVAAVQIWVGRGFCSMKIRKRRKVKWGRGEGSG
jgi:hypothetical protein